MNPRFSLRHSSTGPRRFGRAVLAALALLIGAAHVRAEDAPNVPAAPILSAPVATGDGTGTALAEGVPAAGRSKIRLTDIIHQMNPRTMYRTARDNWRNGNFYATDNSGGHPTWQAALRRSVAPVDMRANVSAAVLNKIHPFKLAGNLLDPLGIELQREISSGQGIHFGQLVKALHPVVIGTTLVGGAAGDIAGAVVQSTLARFGPVGAAVGFFTRPVMGFAGQLFGLNVGEGMVNGKSFKASVAESLRQIKPGRDTGQLFGGVIGGTLGQVLIPIPVVGGIIGGMIGGTVGALLGNTLSKFGPFAWAEHKITSWLGDLADKLDPREKKPEPKAQEPVPTSPDHAPVLGSSTPGSDAPRPQPAGGFQNPLDLGPSMADLPLAKR